MPNPTNKDIADQANPNTLADILRLLGLGGILRALPAALRNCVPTADGYVAATARILPTQSIEAPAARITNAYARSGGVTGALAVVATVPPATGQISIAPNGKIITLGADAITNLDVQYEPQVGDVLEMTLPVASDTLTFPAALAARGVVTLLEAEALAATSTGKKIILAPAAAPAAGQASLNAAKSAVAFNAGDAVTSARVKILVASADDVQALLSADATIL